MQKDLLTLLSGAGDIDNAIVLTHNIDFLFVEALVLESLRKCGQPTLTVLCDARCARESFERQHPVLSRIGLRYRVVPIQVTPGFRFHPKALLLSGAAKAELFVGSGNLTYGGWRENAEIWARYDSQTDGTAPFAAFRAFLLELQALSPAGEDLTVEIARAFDPKNHSWAQDMAPAAGLAWKAGAGEALLSRLSRDIGMDSPDRLVVCAPYFDEDGEALDGIVKAWKATRTEVLVQSPAPAHGLSESVAKQLPADVVVRRASHLRKRKTGDKEAFVHAKAYAFEKDGQLALALGSANCSRAALTIPGKGGNVELMALIPASGSALANEGLVEVLVSDDSVVLATPIVDADGDPTSQAGPLQVTAASFENGTLTVRYVAVAQCHVKRALADKLVLAPEGHASGQVRFAATRRPKTLVLEGELLGATVQSNIAWVHDEVQLRTASRARRFSDTVRRLVRPDTWDIGGWAELLKVFEQHLDYVPPSRFLQGQGKDEPPKPGDNVALADVFAKDYGKAATERTDWPTALQGAQSLQAVLLRYFSPVTGSADDEPPAAAEAFGATDDQSADDENLPEVGAESLDEEVDRAVSLLGGIEKAAVDRKTPSASELAKGRRLAEQVVATMLGAGASGDDYMRKREPELLAADLKVLSVLFRVGHRQRWLETDVLFSKSLEIWSALFERPIGPSGSQVFGWLSERQRSAPAGEDFFARVASVELAAALTTWFLALPWKKNGINGASALAMCVLSVARLPTFWLGGSAAQFVRNVAELLFATAATGEPANHDAELRRAYAEWSRVLKWADAVRWFDSMVAGKDVRSLRLRLSVKELRSGDLLWQGSQGFCISAQDWSPKKIDPDLVFMVQSARGADRDLIPIRQLKAGSTPLKLQASAALPVEALLKLPEFAGHPEHSRHIPALLELVRTIANLSASGEINE